MNRVRVAVAALVATALLASGPLGIAATPSADVTGGPSITADAAVLIDQGTGRVLWSKNADDPRAPASTTKMMTALVALEVGQPGQLIEISPAAAATPGSSAGLSPGERFSLADLLRGLLLRSGNDAATAIAIALAGSVPGFAALMNQRAAALGLVNTHFVNPHGLTADDHYASAYDLALIARAGLEIPAFAEIVNSAEAEMAGTDPLRREIRRELHNTNRLLVTYDWVDGVKTGTTAAAGNCLVASGTRGGLQLIAVVLHSDDRWGDAMRLLQWGYSHFSALTPATAGQRITTLPVVGARDRRLRLPVVAAAPLTVPVALDELPRVGVRLDLPARLSAPVRDGEQVGLLTVRLGNETLASVPLIADAAAVRAPWWQRLLHGAL